jgi:hypothetical protein
MWTNGVIYIPLAFSFWHQMNRVGEEILRGIYYEEEKIFMHA